MHDIVLASTEDTYERQHRDRVQNGIDLASETRHETGLDPMGMRFGDERAFGPEGRPQHEVRRKPATPPEFDDRRQCVFLGLSGFSKDIWLDAMT